MLDRAVTSHAPIDGRANQPAPEVWASLTDLVDPTLEVRKGRLYLLIAPGIDPAVPAEVCRRYYMDTSFDVLPSLRGALGRVYPSVPEGEGAIPVAVVIQGLEMYAVGTPEGALWLVRGDGVRELLTSRTESWTMELPEEGRKGEPGRRLVYNVQRRLSVGDDLVLTTRHVSEGLTPASLRHHVQSGGSPSSIAQAIARLAARAARTQPVPVTVIHIPGFSPMPDLGPAKGRPEAPEAPAKVRAPRQASPIWPALVLALLAIAVSWWLRRPRVSGEDLSLLVGWLLTPAPATTAGLTNAPSPGRAAGLAGRATPQPGRTEAEPTSTRTPRPRRTAVPSLTPSPTTPQQYAMPELLYPLEGGKVRDFSLTLRWAWAGALAEDEYFDVRLWRVGTERRGIAWTKNREYTQRYLQEGGYLWTVVVIRGSNGIVESELSQEPKAVIFDWQLSDAPVATSTPVPTTAPTRSTPVGQPTRVTPEATPAPTMTASSDL